MTSVWFATSPQLADMGGICGGNRDISPLVGDGEIIELKTGFRLVGAMPYAVGKDFADQLWTLSEQLTGM